jgi:hypothetical protein
VRLVLLALARPLALTRSPQAALALEIRVFNGGEEVTSDARISVHRPGERSSPVARSVPHSDHLEIHVPLSICDVQAIREKEGVSGARGKEAARRVDGAGYALFVVPAGRYVGTMSVPR